MTTLNVLIVDDHALMRAGLRSILALEPAMHVVGEAASGNEAIAMELAMRPDIVLMDVSMPEGDGIEATRQLTEAGSKAKVIALSASSDSAHVRAMFDAGAVGYLLKSSSGEELLAAIRTVWQHGAYVSPSVAPSLFNQRESGAKTFPPQRALSEREREVVRMIALGLTSKEIASELSLAPSTIETYRRHIAEKLNLRSVAEITRYAIRNGLASLD